MFLKPPGYWDKQHAFLCENIFCKYRCAKTVSIDSWETKENGSQSSVPIDLGGQLSDEPMDMSVFSMAENPLSSLIYPNMQGDRLVLTPDLWEAEEKHVSSWSTWIACA